MTESRKAILKDPVLTEAFFKEPKIANEVTPPFGLPQDMAEMDSFFNSHGAAYQAGVAALVDELKALTKKQGILDADSANALDVFLDKIKFKVDNTSVRYRTRIFPLLTDGIRDLTKIVTILKEMGDEKWTNTTQTRIQKLMRKMGVCDDIVNAALHDTLVDLMSADLMVELMSIRRQLGEKVGQRLIDKHNKAFGGDTEIEPGSDEHYVKNLLNSHHAELGLYRVKDSEAETYVPTADITSEFEEQMSEALTAGYIVNEMMHGAEEQIADFEAALPLLSRTDEEARKSAAKKFDAFNQWLDKIGTDEQNLLELMAEEVEDDVYKFKPHAELYLAHTICVRLRNRGFFNESQFSVTASDDKVFHIPPRASIDLAYVTFKDKSKQDLPFIIHYIQTFFDDIKFDKNKISELKKLCSAIQLEELHRRVAIEWSRRTTGMNDKNAVLFHEYFPKLAALMKSDATWKHLLEMLKSTHQSAGCFAKGIYRLLTLLQKEQALIVNAMQFLKMHPRNADDIAELIILFRQGLLVDIDEAMFLFFAENQTRFSSFVSYVSNKDFYKEFMILVEAGVLSLDDIKRLAVMPYSKEVIRVIADLLMLDSGLCLDNMDALLDNGANINLLHFVQRVLDECKAYQVALTGTHLAAIFNNLETYPASIDHATLLSLANELGMRELANSLAASKPTMNS